ncbi:MAG: glycine/betaine ABC transporter substrate-binding protein [Deltaproteobacteria bacterium]|nr:MAG: glycine/betaine ABC transporter substrate-binding protein [Deltaproteobacteria bacterium]
MRMRILSAMMLMVVCICGSLGTALAGHKGKVRLAYVEWDCATATTNVARAVLEEKMGYDVEILPVAAAAMWAATASGDVDGMMAAWLPVTHSSYLKRFSKKVVDLGPLVTGAKIGLVVPDYVTIDSIGELGSHAGKFSGRIIGIDPGAGVMAKAEKAIEDYHIKGMELMEGSGATMTAALSDAIKHHQWVVVTGWAPHWKFGRWQLKFLEDPKGVFGKAENIHTVVRKGLSTDKPEVYRFLDRFKWTRNNMETVMAWDQEPGANRYENAKRFVREHPELVDSWLK